jgi:hypothetical protein
VKDQEQAIVLRYANPDRYSSQFENYFAEM